MVNEHTLRIRALNDRLRRTGRGGQIVITAGIQSLGPIAVADIHREVQAFDSFTTHNDPYGEHDFGYFKYQRQRIFWKIDYFAADKSGRAPNPADSIATFRVLTILLSAEY